MGFEIKKDEIAERLDELADLGAIWNKHRAAGRMPNSIRQAMMMVIDEIGILKTIDEQNLLGERRMENMEYKGKLAE